MATLPESVPAGCRVASWRDYGRLMLISPSTMVLVLWRSLFFRASAIALFSLITITLALLAPLDGRGALLLAGFVIAVVAVLPVILLAGLNGVRLLDPRRMVLLSREDLVCVDAVFRRGRSLSLRNHGRAFGAKSAPTMREAVKEWIRPLIGDDFVIVAQNARVARMYMEQFPELHIVGRDWMGHPKLAVRPEFAHVDIEPH